MYAVGAFISFMLFWVFRYQYLSGELNPIIYTSTALQMWYLITTLAFGLLAIVFLIIHSERR